MTDQNNGSIAAPQPGDPGHNMVVAGVLLGSLIERVERLEEEKRTIAADIKEIYAEAKGDGFDTKIMRQLIKERRMDKDDLDEQEVLLDTYRRALGMLVDTPLGEAAVERLGGARRQSNSEAAGPLSGVTVICPNCGDATEQSVGLDEFVCGNCDHAFRPRDHAFRPKKPMPADAPLSIRVSAEEMPALAAALAKAEGGAP